MRILASMVILTAWLRAAEIPAGTRLLLRAEQTVSSRTAKPGDRVRFRTVFAAVDGDRVVVPAGSVIDAEVAAATKSKWVRGRGQLSIQPIRIVLPNGKFYPLVALNFGSFPSEAISHPKHQHWLGVAGVFAGLYTIGAVAVGSSEERAAIGAIDAGLLTAGLWRRGTEIEIRDGMELSAFFDEAVPLD